MLECMKMEILLVLHNIRSVYNVGAILRTAEGLGVDKVVFSGYTPRYDDRRMLPHLRAKLDKQIEKAALGAEKLVPQESVDDLPGWLEKMKMTGWEAIGLENNLDPSEAERKVILGTKKFGEKNILVLGEEVAGIPLEVRAECEAFLEIPMKGQKESFNVSVATGIALWELMRDKLVGEGSALV